MFDIHFTKFITISWITIIWVLLIVGHFFVLGGGMVALSYSAVQANREYAEAKESRGGYSPWGRSEPTYQGPPAWLFLVFPLGVAASLLVCRIMLECTIVFFRNEANTRVTKEHYLRIAKAEKYDAE